MTLRTTHAKAVRTVLAIMVVLSLSAGGFVGSVAADDGGENTATLETKPTGTLSPIGLIMRPLDEHTCVDSSQWDLGIDDCMA